MKNLFVLLLTMVAPLLAGSVAPIPEPSTALLVGGGVVGLMLWFRKKRGRK